MVEPAVQEVTIHEAVAHDIVAQTPWIRRLAQSLVRDPSLADDVVQETLLTALRHGAPNRKLPRSWYATVVRNYVRFWYRGDRRRSAREVDHGRFRGLVSDESPSAELELRELRDRIVNEVDRLDEPYRTTVRMRYLEERSVAEIAETLKVAESTIRVRLARIHRDLVARLRSIDSADEPREPRFLAGLWLFAAVEPDPTAPPAAPIVPWSTATRSARFGWGTLVAASGLMVVLLALFAIDLSGANPELASLDDAEQRLRAARSLTAADGDDRTVAVPAAGSAHDAAAASVPTVETSPTPEPATEFDPNATVIRVLEATSGAPVEGAAVYLEPVRAAIETGLSATQFLLTPPDERDSIGTTDSDGLVAVSERELTSFNLRVVANGYRGHYETVRARVEESHVVRLDPPPETDLRIVYPDGRPVTDLPIAILGSDGTRRTLPTDEHGRLAFAWDAWAHAVEVEAPGFASMQVAAATPNMELELRAGFPLEGRIVDETGEPVVGCEIEVVTNYWEGFPRVSTTDEHGEFRSFWVTDPANLRITLRHPDFGVERLTRELTKEEARLELVFRHGTWVDGRILPPIGNASVSATVRAYPRGRSYFNTDVRSAECTADGRFELRVPPGDYWLRVESPGMTTEELALQATGERVSLEAIPLEPGRVILGTIRDRDGLPVSGARVRIGTIRGDSIVGPEAVSDELGEFEFIGLTRDPRPMDPARRDTRWWFLCREECETDYALEIQHPFVFREVNGVPSPILPAHGPVSTQGVARCERLDLVVDRERPEPLVLDLRTPDGTEITSSASVIVISHRWMLRVFAGMDRELDGIRNIESLDGSIVVVKSDYTAWGFRRLQQAENPLRLVLQPWTVRTFHVRDDAKRPIEDFGLYLAPVVDGHSPRAALAIGRSDAEGRIESHDIGPGTYDVYRDDGTPFDVCARPVKDLILLDRVDLGLESDVWIDGTSDLSKQH